jgi:hydroxyethylthiazole kinase-like uncharacterized protein yjeF
LITPALLRSWPLPKLDGEHGKKERGLVLVVGGSKQIPGAAILAAVGALRAGAGTVQIATSRSVAPAVAVRVPEARVIGLRETRNGEIAAQGCSELDVHIGKCDAVLVGPGMHDSRAGASLVASCLRGETKAALVVDAAALTAFSRSTRSRRPHAGGVIMTPHAGEMARLWNVSSEEVTADPHAIARAAAVELNAVVALKGAETYIAAPDGRTFRNTSGNLGLGTSGSGDALAGVIAGLCARGADPLQAAVWGVSLHAQAGEVLARALGPLGFLARELLIEIPPLLAKLAR